MYIATDGNQLHKLDSNVDVRQIAKVTFAYIPNKNNLLLFFFHISDVDTCEEWIECNNETIKSYLNTSNLPSCPCYYPLHLDYNNKVWDRHKQKHFRWHDIIMLDESVKAYKPKAHYCIRSKLYRGTKTLAAQSCCYDDTMRLITRGKSAGTPNLISPEISPELHQKLDISPWIICKGDWTR